LSEDAAPGPIRLALVIEDSALAERLAALLAGVPGLRLVGATEAADAAVVPSIVSAEGDFPLRPRELEVLALLAEGASNKVIARRLHFGSYRQVPRRLASGQARRGWTYRCRRPCGAASVPVASQAGSRASSTLRV
jgi:Bacterial regulatory proteins, luxR family